MHVAQRQVSRSALGESSVATPSCVATTRLRAASKATVGLAICEAGPFRGQGASQTHAALSAALEPCREARERARARKKDKRQCSLEKKKDSKLPLVLSKLDAFETREEGERDFSRRTRRDERRARRRSQRPPCRRAPRTCGVHSLSLSLSFVRVCVTVGEEETRKGRRLRRGESAFESCCCCSRVLCVVACTR